MPQDVEDAIPRWHKKALIAAASLVVFVCVVAAVVSLVMDSGKKPGSTGGASRSQSSDPQAATGGQAATPVKKRDYSIFASTPPWVLVVFFLIGVIAFLIAFKWAKHWVAGDSFEDRYRNFSIAQLRDLRDQGVITQSEYDRAKTTIAMREIESMRGKDS